MGVDVILVTEDGERIDGVADEKNLLHRLLPSVDDPSFVYLGCIDWYGDTVFNHLQMPRFLTELERLRQSAQGADERTLLFHIADLAHRCRDGVHTYLKFCGD